MVMYKMRKWLTWPMQPQIQLFVSEMEFNRSMSQLVKGARETKTVVFPNTVRENSERTFSYSALQSVILNDGLETIGPNIFCSSKIKKIIVPKNVTEIEDWAFHGCENLKQVVFEEGSKLEAIGLDCFYNSRLEEITLPRTLKEVGHSAFENCYNLRSIYLDDECEVSLYKTEIPDSTIVNLHQEITVLNTKLLDLRNCKHVTIPDGVEKIGNHWFCSSEIESVKIPASVREIGIDAFFMCKSLKCVVFAEGSMLEKIEIGSFSKTGLEKITIPKGVIEIEKDAFYLCEKLKEVVFEKGSKLEKIEKHCFRKSGIEEITLLKTLKRVDCYAFDSCDSL